MTEAQLFGTYTRLFHGGTRFELEDNGQTSILRVHGSYWTHQRYGTFVQAANPSTARVVIGIAPSSNGPQDVIFKVNPTFTKIKYAVRPREGSKCARRETRRLADRDVLSVPLGELVLCTSWKWAQQAMAAEEESRRGWS